MLPLVFLGLSQAVFRFSRVVVGLFVRIASCEDIMIFQQKSWRPLDGTDNNTGRPFRVLPLVFSELFQAVFRFSRVAVGLFVLFASCEDIMIFHQKSWRPIIISGPSSDKQAYYLLSRRNRLIVGCSKNQTTIEFWRNRKLFQNALGKLCWAFGGVYRCLGLSRKVKCGYSVKELTSWSPDIISRKNWSNVY